MQENFAYAYGFIDIDTLFLSEEFSVTSYNTTRVVTVKIKWERDFIDALFFSSVKHAYKLTSSVQQMTNNLTIITSKCIFCAL